MKLVYLRGKKPKILDNCGYNNKYDSYFRRLTRYDGVEWLNGMKVLGIIESNGLYSPKFPYSTTPEYIQNVAKLLNLKIEMDEFSGKGKKLYYYNGQYYRAKDLFPELS
jgi:hypothetical protein